MVSDETIPVPLVSTGAHLLGLRTPAMVLVSPQASLSPALGLLRQGKTDPISCTQPLQPPLPQGLVLLP